MCTAREAVHETHKTRETHTRQSRHAHTDDTHKRTHTRTHAQDTLNKRDNQRRAHATSSARSLRPSTQPTDQLQTVSLKPNATIIHPLRDSPLSSAPPNERSFAYGISPHEKLPSLLRSPFLTVAPMRRVSNKKSIPGQQPFAWKRATNATGLPYLSQDRNKRGREKGKTPTQQQRTDDQRSRRKPGGQRTVDPSPRSRTCP